MTTIEHDIATLREWASTKTGRQAILAAQIMSDRALHYFTRGRRKADGTRRPTIPNGSTLLKLETLCRTQKAMERVARHSTAPITDLRPVSSKIS